MTILTVLVGVCYFEVIEGGSAISLEVGDWISLGP
jgi:hypothetical protein